MNIPRQTQEDSWIQKPKKPMSIAQLIKAVKNTVVTKADIDRLEKRLAESEKKFKEESRRKRITEEFLQRRYTI